MEEEIQPNSASSVASTLGYRSRTKPRKQGTDYYEYKGLIQPYETYSKQITQRIEDFDKLKENDDYKKYSALAKENRNKVLQQSRQQAYAPLMDLIGKNKDIQFKKVWSNPLSFQEWRKHKKDTDKIKYTEWKGLEEDINGDNYPEFVIRDHRGFIQSADGLRVTAPIKRQRVTKYFTENPTKADREAKHYKAWKQEDNPATGYRHFIKNYLSPFLKERGYTIAQVYSVIGGRIWKGVIAPWLLQYYDKSYQAQSFVDGNATSLAIYKKLSKAIKQAYDQYFINGHTEQRDNQMEKLIQVGYAAFWNVQLGDIPTTVDDNGDKIFVVPSAATIRAVRDKRDAKRNEELERYNKAMLKIRARRAPTFAEGKTLKNARLLPYTFNNDLNDYVIEDEDAEVE
ncbi:MAG: hypothetical protein EZS28_003296 [Streblomastix strix]|uniref:Uncharacterized protein n=1 Tax=Streblomastix strix TaxID=222440 RepID=A0A5J4X1J5_9EUKA|nr:MAG: hypothetical protein EZS28_003296 [Streblomastix strix]